MLLCWDPLLAFEHAKRWNCKLLATEIEYRTVFVDLARTGGSQKEGCIFKKKKFKGREEKSKVLLSISTLPASAPSRKYCTTIITFPEGWRSTLEHSWTRESKRCTWLCGGRGPCVTSYPELRSPIGFLAALGQDGHSNRGFRQRLLCRFHQQHLQHPAFVDVCVETGVPSRVHGGFPLNQGLTSL